MWQNFRVAQKSRKTSQTESHNEKSRLWRPIRAITRQGLTVWLKSNREINRLWWRIRAITRQGLWPFGWKIRCSFIFLIIFRIEKREVHRSRAEKHLWTNNNISYATSWLIISKSSGRRVRAAPNKLSSNSLMTLLLLTVSIVLFDSTHNRQFVRRCLTFGKIDNVHEFTRLNVLHYVLHKRDKYG